MAHSVSARTPAMTLGSAIIVCLVLVVTLHQCSSAPAQHNEKFGQGATTLNSTSLPMNTASAEWAQQETGNPPTSTIILQKPPLPKDPKFTLHKSSLRKSSNFSKKLQMAKEKTSSWRSKSRITTTTPPPSLLVKPTKASFSSTTIPSLSSSSSSSGGSDIYKNNQFVVGATTHIPAPLSASAESPELTSTQSSDNPLVFGKVPHRNIPTFLAPTVTFLSQLDEDSQPLNVKHIDYSREGVDASSLSKKSYTIVGPKILSKSKTDAVVGKELHRQKELKQENQLQTTTSVSTGWQDFLPPGQAKEGYVSSVDTNYAAGTPLFLASSTPSLPQYSKDFDFASSTTSSSSIVKNDDETNVVNNKITKVTTLTTTEGYRTTTTTKTTRRLPSVVSVIPEFIIKFSNNGERTDSQKPESHLTQNPKGKDNDENKAGEPVRTTSSQPEVVMLLQRQKIKPGGDTVKLIDLERKKFKSIEAVNQPEQVSQHTSATLAATDSKGFSTPQPSLSVDDLAAASGIAAKKMGDDVGHDGVKITKKKQLIDKHFTAAGNDENALGAVILPDKHNPRIEKENIVGQVHLSPTGHLMPVPNGYLGPIFMEEKSFSIFHPAPASSHHHQTSIESQVRDGTLVEIIAPMVAEEGTSTTTEAAKPAVVQEAFHNPDYSSTVLSVLSSTVFQVRDIPSSTTRLSALSEPHDSSASPIISTTNYHQKTLSPLHSYGAEQQTESYPSQYYPTSLSSDSKNDESTESNLSLLSLMSHTSTGKEKQTESKISDIQIEIYDSTADSIIASTNFNDKGVYSGSAGTTKTPTAAMQGKFTQYVVDRKDFSTQKSNATPLSGSGRPEPAAIEIHINVSEGFGNESEDLEFSYRQADYPKSSLRLLDEFAAARKSANTSFITLKPFDVASGQNDTVSAAASSIEADEILVVEIIDAGDNSTENTANRDNLNPIFTFRSDGDTEVELKDVKYYGGAGGDTTSSSSKRNSVDDLFLPDVKKEEPKSGVRKVPAPLPPRPPPPRKTSKLDRDSDTIFYISNTEVKVGESLPTVNTHSAQQQLQLKRARLEDQFFPANYKPPESERQNESKTMEFRVNRRYEQDLVLSPLPTKADSLKVIRIPGEKLTPLDVTYMGESSMDVEQSTLIGRNAGNFKSTSSVPPTTTQLPIQSADVIIQPAILPEISIGVPVIGELPPQIELSEIDFMPVETNKRVSIIDDGDNDNDENVNDLDRIVESSIQYGGDLIDERGVIAGGGFDALESSYPFGNMAAMRRRQQHPQSSSGISSQLIVNHGVNNLRKDELIADLIGSSESSGAGGGSGIVGSDPIINAPLVKRNNDSSVNGSSGGSSERMGNATAYSVMEEPTAAEDFNFADVQTLVVACFATLLPLILSVFMAFGLRHLYRKYQANPIDRNSSSDPLANEKSEDGDHEESQRQRRNSQPGQVPPADSTADVIGLVQSRGEYSTADDGGIIGVASAVNVSYRSETASTPLGATARNYSGPNGSVTTMTLKNNHLIVETEERNDISRNARETKMHYNTSEKDGVFVVEVSRGIDSKTMPSSPIGDEKRVPLLEIKQHCISANVTVASTEKNHEEVLIHQPPPEHPSIVSGVVELGLHQIDEVDELNVSPKSSMGPPEDNDLECNIGQHPNTGLSQSDLSSTSSSNGSNKRYSYGNQELYTIEPSGYTIPSRDELSKISPSKNVQKNDDDRKSENGHCNEYSHESSPAAESGNFKENGEELSTKEKHGEETSQSIQHQDSHMNGHSKQDECIESKPIVTITILKQNSTEVPAQKMTNGCGQHNQVADVQILNNGQINTECEDNTGEQRKSSPQKNVENLKTKNDSNGTVPRESHIINDTPENGFDSIMSLPDPPSTEEFKEMNEIVLSDMNQLDSLPPPPPPVISEANGVVISAYVSPAHQQQQSESPQEYRNGNGHETNGYSEHQSPPSTPTSAPCVKMLPTATTATTMSYSPHSNGTATSFQLHHQPIPTIAVDVTGCS